MVEVAAQTGIGHHAQTFAEAVDGHLVNDFVQEGGEKQQTRLVAGDAALLKVEEGFFVELADGGAVRAADIVGVDDELRLGIGAGGAAEADVTACLLRVGTRAMGIDLHKALEAAHGFFVENLLEQLAVAAAGGSVGDGDGIRHLLRARGDGHAGNVGCGSFGTHIQQQAIGDAGSTKAEYPQRQVARVV